MNDSEMFEKIITLKSQVGYILKRSVEARNSDAVLIEKVCKQFGYNPIEKASGIERCRRWYNQHGEYLPTSKEVAIKRNLNMATWRSAMGYDGQFNF